MTLAELCDVTYAILVDQVVTQAVAERNAAIIAIAVSGADPAEADIPTVDEVIVRLDDALFSADDSPEKEVDQERLALRRALNLPDVPASMTGRR